MIGCSIGSEFGPVAAAGQTDKAQEAPSLEDLAELLKFDKAVSRGQ